MRRLACPWCRIKTYNLSLGRFQAHKLLKELDLWKNGKASRSSVVDPSDGDNSPGCYVEVIET